MSSFKAALLALCLLVTAITSSCGFEPLYSGKAVNRPAIDIANIPDQEGQYLRNLLIDQLETSGRPADAPYKLVISPLVKSIVNIGIQKDATATRAQMEISTHMQLIDQRTGKPVLERDLKNVGAYNLLNDQLSTLVSQRSTTDVVLQELCDDVVRELDLYFRGAPA